MAVLQPSFSRPIGILFAPKETCYGENERKRMLASAATAGLGFLVLFIICTVILCKMVFREERAVVDKPTALLGRQSADYTAFKLDQTPKWRSAREVHSAISDLQSVGFQFVGYFLLPKQDGLRFAALLRE